MYTNNMYANTSPAKRRFRFETKCFNIFLKKLLFYQYCKEHNACLFIFIIVTQPNCAEIKSNSCKTAFSIKPYKRWILS